MSAATASPVVTRSASSRQYNSSSDTRHRRTTSQSTSRPSGEGHRTDRPEPTSGSHNRGSTTLQQQSLASVARRDYESTNLPATQQNSRRSTSRDQYAPGSPGVRAETNRPTHHRTESQNRRPRYSEDVPRSAGSAAPADMASVQQRSAESEAPSSSSTAKRGRTTLDMPATGVWALQKTIGAGSMGKVKLARNFATGEQCALKIVPRQSTEEYRSERERQRADHSKDVRTQREAAIVKLLKHPYICGMRDVLATNHHWYMLFEYVNGGQMLDYIISHGKLKEKQARKFARQIASALDYCHKNSIVHRDLKIENILISKTGDIKIIDFGLSNLYSPGDLLKTFCGSLYFAAPELLQAQHYDGPEVDVWSFGIVLYVLVCGKVPFDDQSMPQLHAKIKKGLVDYPNWLTAECKHLISRMLVTDRKQRAPLSEIMTHPWMTKGYSGPLENYLPPREPIKLPLDPEICEHMSGFDFGTPDQITEKLTSIIDSEKYQSAVRTAQRETIAQTPSSSDRKRGAFFKRRNSTASRDSIVNPSTEAITAAPDPLSAFAKELSIYYLARERLVSEKVEKNLNASTVPAIMSGDPLSTPDIAPPQAAYTNASTYESPGEKPTGGRSRPRARTHGEDEMVESVAKTHLSPPTMNANANAPPSSRMESMTGGLFRRFSSRRTKERPLVNEQRRPEMSEANQPLLKPPGEAATAISPSPLPRKSFSVRGAKPRLRDQSPLSLSVGGADGQKDAVPSALSNPMTRAGARLLGRSSSVNSADVRRRRQRAGSPGAEVHHPLPLARTEPSTKPSSTASSERTTTAGGALPKVRISEPISQDDTALEDSHSGSTAPQRSSTGRTKSLKHAQPDQARRVKRSEERAAMGNSPLSRQGEVREETSQELSVAEGRRFGRGDGALDEGAESQTEMKPVFLKGLFSVSTTSTKPVGVIRMDLIRVLRDLGVQFWEIKGGFSCLYAPGTAGVGGQNDGAGDSKESRDLEKAAMSTRDDKTMKERPSFQSTQSHRRRISFHGLIGKQERDREEQSTTTSRERLSPRSPAKQYQPTTPMTPRTPGAENTDVDSDQSEEDSAATASAKGIRDRGIGGGSAGASGRGMPAGETTTHVQSDMGENVTLRFEIFVVKVPLFALHGIRFVKTAGGTWNYKEMAQRILDRLRL